MPRRTRTASKRPHRRVTSEHAATMATRYTTTNESIRTIAVDMGFSYGAVHHHLLRAGVTLRPRGGRRRQLPTTDTPPVS